MSPEQVTGASLDGRTDIFSLGVVLYEMLTGRTPFDGRDLANLMYKITHESPQPPSIVLPGVPVEFDAIVARALAKNREHRYQSAGDLAHDLRSLAPLPDNGVGSQTLPPTLTAIPEEEILAKTVILDPEPPIGRYSRRRLQMMFVSVLSAAMFGAGIVVAVDRLMPLGIERAGGKPVLLEHFDVPVAAMLAQLQQSAAVNPFAVPAAPPPIPNHKVDVAPAPADAAKVPARSKPMNKEEARAAELDERLKQLRNELADLKSRYTDLHPDVMTKQRQIRRTEQELETLK
jgi:hypothetical protein